MNDFALKKFLQEEKCIDSYNKLMQEYVIARRKAIIDKNWTTLIDINKKLITILTNSIFAIKQNTITVELTDSDTLNLFSDLLEEEILKYQENAEQKAD